METATLTVCLPKQDLEFAEQYARARRITVNELVDRLLRRLRNSEKIRSGSARSKVDAWQELFRVGDALAAEDPPGSQTLTAAVLAMRR
ncbi:MAG TPA: hypothetical protein VGG06_19085 [Thermoanaerobaculia bacterium]|jgi:hypothetical protein